MNGIVIALSRSTFTHSIHEFSRISLIHNSITGTLAMLFHELYAPIKFSYDLFKTSTE